MRSIQQALILGLTFLFSYGIAVAAPCSHPRAMAPGKFDLPDPWGNDGGVVVDGFLDLASSSGPQEVSHGVDLYRYQAHADYDELKRCGTQFAILKYAPNQAHVFASHAAGLARVGIPVWPYFYLGMDSAYRFNRERFEAADPSNADYAAMAETGRAEARDMIVLYRSATNGALQGSFGGISGRVVFLDVEDKLDTSGKSAMRWRAAHGLGSYAPLPVRGDEINRETTTRLRYSRLYASKVAGWIQEFRAAFPDAIIVLYTSPSVFTDYLINGRIDDFATYHGLPVWLANYRDDGGEVDWTTCNQRTSAGCKGAHRLCLSADGGNRCIVHQYTARGVFGVKSPPGPGPAEHIDLSRLFPVEVKQDGYGLQYVRRTNVKPSAGRRVANNP